MLEFPWDPSVTSYNLYQCNFTAHECWSSCDWGLGKGQHHEDAHSDPNMIQLHHWGSQKVRTPHCDYSCTHPSLLLLSSFLLPPPSPLFVAVGASKAAWLSISCYETSVMSAPMKGWSCLSRWSPAGGFSDCRRGCHLGMKASIQRHLGEWMPSDYFCICHLQFCSFLHVIRAGHPRESKWHWGWVDEG